jgi:hypothetical protein
MFQFFFRILQRHIHVAFASVRGRKASQESLLDSVDAQPASHSFTDARDRHAFPSTTTATTTTVDATIDFDSKAVSVVVDSAVKD